MARTDTVADILTMIRNAVMAKKDSAVIPASKIVTSILEILKEEGYIENYKEQAASSKAKTIKVYLKYDAQKNPVITGLRRISRPGLRTYSRYAKMPSVLRGFGRAIISTSQGLMTDKQAKEKKLGGEILCYVW